MKAELLKALKEVHKTVRYPEFGICGNVLEYFWVKSSAEYDKAQDYLSNAYLSGANLAKLFAELFAKWPKYSGCGNYPVPHPTKNPKDAYVLYCKRAGLWSRRTKYGQARWELLEFCISELEKELNDGKS